MTHYSRYYRYENLGHQLATPLCFKIYALPSATVQVQRHLGHCCNKETNSRVHTTCLWYTLNVHWSDEWWELQAIGAICMGEHSACPYLASDLVLSCRSSTRKRQRLLDRSLHELLQSLAKFAYLTLPPLPGRSTSFQDGWHGLGNEATGKIKEDSQFHPTLEWLCKTGFRKLHSGHRKITDISTVAEELCVCMLVLICDSSDYEL